MLHVPSRSLLPAYGALAAAMAIVGANVPLAKYLGAQLPTDLIIAGRCLAATLALLPIVWHSNGFAGLARERWALLLFGFAGVVGYPYLMVTGLKWTDALAAGAITATMPAAVALLSLWFLKERLSLRLWFAVALAVAGVAVLNLAAPASAAGAAPLWGNLIILGAVFCEAAYVIQSKALAARMAPFAMAFGINLAGCLIVVPGAVSSLIFAPPPEAAPLAVAGVVWYGLSSSVLALVLWFWGMGQVPAARAGLFTVFLPLTAGLIAVLALGEPVGLGVLAGGALIIAAIAAAAERAPPPAAELPLPAKVACSQAPTSPPQSESARAPCPKAD